MMIVGLDVGVLIELKSYVFVILSCGCRGCDFIEG